MKSTNTNTNTYENSVTNYPNQREVEIVKPKIDYTGEEGLYRAIYLNEDSAAMKDLKNATYKVFSYFSSNANGYREGISPQKISNYTGLTVKTVQRSIAEMIEKGYLVQSGKQKNKLYFAPMNYYIDDMCKDGEETADPIEDQTQDTMEIDASTGEIIEETNDETDEIIEEAPAEEETDMELSKKTKDQMARIPHHDDETPIEDDLFAPQAVKVREDDSLSEEEAERLHDIITRFKNYQLTDNDDKFTLEELQLYADNSSNYTLEDLKGIYTERAMYFQYLADQKAEEEAQLEAQIAASMECYYGKDLTNVVPFPSKGRERIAK